MAKVRSDATLLNLPADQQDLLAGWLLDGVETDTGRDTSYGAVMTKLYEDLGVKTSTGTLSAFYQRVCAPRRLRIAAAAAGQFVEDAEADGRTFGAATKRLVKQKFFELAASDRVDPKDLIAFGQLAADFDRGELKRRDQEQKADALQIQRDRLQVLIEKNADAKAKLNQVLQSKGGLTPETLRQIEAAAALL